jgi:hypothetical protein
VPVWHAKTKELVKAGKLQSLGIVEEQHPDRAALYMQWQQMAWPVLADPFNLLGVKVVPITFLVDSSGIIRFRNPSEEEFESFLSASYPHTVVEGRDLSFDESLEAREKEVLASPKSPVANFQFGVALRRRFDSGARHDADFLKAIDSWRKALALQPDLYIWRRRIQQYGPRLDKPYSFYDWVNQAREELQIRGEEPLPLSAEPRGSEFAYPSREKEVERAKVKHPDPDGKVPLDEEQFVTTSVVIVPSTKKEDHAIRVHLRFKPSKLQAVHWTNDAGNVSFHFQATEGVTIHDQQGPGAVPAVPATAEERVIEFEVRAHKGEKLPAEIEGSAYYFVCEGTEGVCRFLRKPIKIVLSKSDG